MSLKTYGAQEHDDDAHRLLRVVTPVPEGVEGGRNELEPAEEPVDPVRRRAAGDPRDPDHVEAAEQKPDRGGQHNAEEHQHPTLGLERDEPGFHHRRPPEPADQRV